MISRLRQAGPALAGYLAAHGFTPAPGQPTWHDCRTPDGIIRVVCEDGAETYLISLTPAIACRYKAMFHVGTPAAVIIAAVQAALSLPPDDGTDPSQAASAPKPATRTTSRRAPARRKAGRDDH